MSGYQLRFGSAYRCRFDHSLTVNASLVDLNHEHGGLKCVSPAGLPLGSMPLEISLNGQQFSANELEHVYFTQPTRLTHVSPVTADPTLGGSAVTIHGRGLSAFAACAISCPAWTRRSFGALRPTSA